MRVNKVVLKAVLSTAAAIFILLVVMFAALAFIYPSTMMQFTYDLGMESASIRYARRAYSRSEQIYYIAFATEVAIGEKDYEKIDACGSKFVKDDSFSKYCAEKNATRPEGVTATYQQYVYGQVGVAKYYNGKAEEAIDFAFLINVDSFTQNNAVAAVLLTAIKEEDAEAVAMMRDKLVAFRDEKGTTLADEDGSYLHRMIGFAQVHGS